MVELQILEDALTKKKGILAKIEEENKKQEAILKAEPMRMDDFEAIVDQKTALIDELNQLDQGFESVYDRIKEQLISEQAQHKEKIAVLKDLIFAITGMSVSIQAQETRNKELVEKFFSQTRQDLQSERVRAKAAYDYMNRRPVDVEPRFLDTKK
jgi:flagellar biosynthesis/type III secretory pathway chaperone